MTWQTGLLVTGVALWAAAQYGLAAHALRDLRQRPTVRGNNKVVWALVILGVPIAGALVYTVYGPTSFIRRDRSRPVATLSRTQSSPDQIPDQSPALDLPESNREHPSPAAARATRPSTPLPELADIDTPDPIARNGPAARPAPSPVPRRVERRGRR